MESRRVKKYCKKDSDRSGVVSVNVCITLTDLLGKPSMPPHRDRNCRSYLLSHPITVYITVGQSVLLPGPWQYSH